MEDNRTFWELSFTETGLTEAQRRATTLEAGFGRVQLAANGAATSIEQSFMKASASVLTVADKLGGLESTFQQFAKSGLNFVADKLREVVSLLSDFDQRAVTAFSQRTSSLRAYTTILGDARQAQIEYTKSGELALKTEFTQATAQEAQQRLIVAGYRGKELDRALLAVADVTAMAQPEQRTAKASHTGLIFSELMTEGLLSKRMLNMLGKDVNLSTVLSQLGGGDIARGRERITKREVGTQEGLEAIYAGITSQLGTKKLGEFAVGGSSSLATLLTNLDEAQDILLKSFAGETLPAMQRYKAVLSEQTTNLSTATQQGQEAALMFSDVANALTNVKLQSSAFSTGFTESFVESFNLARAESGQFIAGKDGIQDLGRMFGQIGATVGVVVNRFEKLQTTFDDLSASIGGLVHWLSKAIKNLEYIPGVQIGKQIWKAEQSAAGMLTEGASPGTKAFLEEQNKERKLLHDMFKDMNEKGERVTSVAGTAPLDDAAIAALVERGAPIHGESWARQQMRAQQKALASHQNRRGGGKGLAGFDITDLMSGGNAAPARTIQDNIGDAMRAAGQVSSAPSARGASGASGSDMHGAGSSSPTSVTIEAGAIVVSGVSDPMAAAEEAVRLLSQRIGRLTRAPGAGRSL